MILQSPQTWAFVVIVVSSSRQLCFQVVGCFINKSRAYIRLFLFLFDCLSLSGFHSICDLLGDSGNTAAITFLHSECFEECQQWHKSILTGGKLRKA